MKDNKEIIFKKLKTILAKSKKRMDVREQVGKAYHLYGKKKVVDGKKEIDAMYFASAVMQKNFVGFYFFPIYTHKKEFTKLPKDLAKCLKGKSCFHIKDNNSEIFSEIQSVLEKGRKVYERVGWI